MKKINDQAIFDTVSEAGIGSDKINRVIGTIRISLARQAANEAEKKMLFDANGRIALEESLRIGAKITQGEAKNVVDIFQRKVKEQNDPEVQFLEEGTFEVDDQEIRYKPILE
jgi:hypothetical protein